ncbi:MAG TPA: glycosyltransferase family 4 protein [Vicinamibacteria bacterium]|nr:glycosyltransferase family 4 protein [Vicinamibacteria bacterium]
MSGAKEKPKSTHDESRGSQQPETPLHVAYLITRSDLGGASIHVRDLSRAMIRDGHRVVVLVGGSGPFTEELTRLGIPFEASKHLVREVSPWNDLVALFHIAKRLKQIKPDLLSTHSPKAGWLGRVAAWMAGVPVIFTAHGWAFSEGVGATKQRLYALAERLVARFALKIIAVSDHDRELALQFGVGRPGQFVTVHNGMPEVDDKLRADPSSEPPHLVMVARMEAQKDHTTLLQALKPLANLDWTLSLVGAGPLLADTRRLAEELGLARRVTFMGERRDVAEILAGGQIFLLVSNHEGFPRSILEAMRAGLPVIASDVGGTRESVVDGENGILVQRRDVDGLTRALEKLISNPTLRKRMGDIGRRSFLENFQFATLYAKTRNVYRSVLQERGSMATGESWRDSRSSLNARAGEPRTDAARVAE